MSPSKAAAGGSVAAHDGSETPARAGFWALTIGCIGVVYGDIGTSPLYALRESVLAAVGPGQAASEPVVLGILSLIIWALFLVVTAKYVLILLRADNHGEGGTLALMALASRALGGSRGGAIVILLGIISGALFYGDAIITPALSVLSAIEGLKVVTPAFDDFVVPLTVVILIALFAVQSRGTAKVATFFGPITLIWFAAIAVGGLWHIGQNFEILYVVQSLLRRSLPPAPRHYRLLHPRRRLSGGHRRGSALCRSRSFRPRADPFCLARHRAAVAVDQLSRTGRTGAVQP